MKISYNDWNPKESSLELIKTANQIIQEYQNDNYILTLRQLYYQFVARDIIPNSEKSYKNLGSLITKGRMSGRISWDAIEDRNRNHVSDWIDEDIMNPIKDLPHYIRFDKWARQDYYVEVWVEKEALGNVVSRACEPLSVPYLSCKGYLSASEAWRAGRRIKEASDNGKSCKIIHLGDHDPSGIDMTRDNSTRLDLFSEYSDVEVIRIALNINQVEEFSPPPNPTKVTDSRAKNYIKKFGQTSWELDALEPSILNRLITNQINKYRDINLWDETMTEEIKAKNMLKKIYERWDDIEELIN